MASNQDDAIVPIMEETMTTKKITAPKKRQNTKAKSKKPTKKQVQAAIAATDNAMEQNLLV